MSIFLSRIDQLFNSLEHFWEYKRTERTAANVLIVAFLGTLALIELRRQGLLPDELAAIVPSNHYFAINVAFSMLLGLEVIGLVFSIPNSVAVSIGKQFELSNGVSQLRLCCCHCCCPACPYCSAIL